MYRFIVPRQNDINPEQNGVWNRCQTYRNDVVFHFKNLKWGLTFFLTDAEENEGEVLLHNGK